eukprot:1815396-Karenia_brevis.AAC.1
MDDRSIAIPSCGLGANALEEVAIATHKIIVHFGTGHGPIGSEIGRLNFFPNDSIIVSASDAPMQIIPVLQSTIELV